MKKRWLHLTLTALTAAVLFALPSGARGDTQPDLDHIKVIYHGGALIQHARVATLFWGTDWKKSSLPAYFNQFFRALFADGRYMANLAQYSAGGHEIGNGAFIATATDDVGLSAQVDDAQIQAEIRAQIAADHLPQPETDTLYVVFTPPGVVVVDGSGADSENDFAGYHDYSLEGEFAYVVVPYAEIDGEPRLLTLVASHELAEAVTDPEPGLQRTWRGGWYDETNGEIGDIPASLLDARRIDEHGFADVLTGADGRRYLVQKEWSNRDNAPVAFAQRTAS